MHSVQFVSNWSSGIETYEPHQGGQQQVLSSTSLADKFTARWPGESKLSQFWIPTNTSPLFENATFCIKSSILVIDPYPALSSQGTTTKPKSALPTRHHTKWRSRQMSPGNCRAMKQRCRIDGIRWIWTIWISKIQRNIPIFVDHDWTTMSGDLWNRRLGNHKMEWWFSIDSQ